MEVRLVDAGGVQLRAPDELDLRAPLPGFWWIDVPVWDEEAERALRQLGCHPMVLEQCVRRNYVPTVHAYEDHVFVTTQSPLLGEAGHVHLLELDQVIGQRYLVTVHGPLNPAVDVAAALVETDGVVRRLAAGRFRPTGPVELSYAVTTAVARRQRDLVTAVAERLPGLEQEVMSSRLRNPEELLERMFLVRHELLTGRTMAAQCHDVWSRIAQLDRLPGDAGRASDLADQFDRIRSVADGESQFLFGVIELYQTKVHTKMTVAMERLAVIAAVTLPVTAIASVMGMNLIVGEATSWWGLLLVVTVMLVISALLLRWARRQGWW